MIISVQNVKIQNHVILAEDICNMDETGFQMGMA